MNYAYLGERLSHSAAENFPVFVADSVPVPCGPHYRFHPIAPGTPRTGDEFPSSQALLDYATHRLLWSWYRRDRDIELGAHGASGRSDPDLNSGFGTDGEPDPTLGEPDG